MKNSNATASVHIKNTKNSLIVDWTGSHPLTSPWLLSRLVSRISLERS